MFSVQTSSSDQRSLFSCKRVRRFFPLTIVMVFVILVFRFEQEKTKRGPRSVACESIATLSQRQVYLTILGLLVPSCCQAAKAKSWRVPDSILSWLMISLHDSIHIIMCKCCKGFDGGSASQSLLMFRLWQVYSIPYTCWGFLVYHLPCATPRIRDPDPIKGFNWKFQICSNP